MAYIAVPHTCYCNIKNYQSWCYIWIFLTSITYTSQAICHDLYSCRFYSKPFQWHQIRLNTYQITSSLTVCSTACSGWHQEKDQCSTSLVLYEGNHRWFPTRVLAYMHNWESEPKRGIHSLMKPLRGTPLHSWNVPWARLDPGCDPHREITPEQTHLVSLGWLCPPAVRVSSAAHYLRSHTCPGNLIRVTVRKINLT